MQLLIIAMHLLAQALLLSRMKTPGADDLLNHVNVISFHVFGPEAPLLSTHSSEAMFKRTLDMYAMKLGELCDIDGRTCLDFQRIADETIKTLTVDETHVPLLDDPEEPEPSGEQPQ